MTASNGLRMGASYNGWGIPQENTFNLYGVSFRWTQEGIAHPLEKNVVTLVREYKPFPENHVLWLTRGNKSVPWFGTVGRGYAHRFDGIADFLLPRDGSTLRAFVRPEADPWALGFVLFRGVIPRLLHLRGIPCLHASAVRVGQSTVGFLGPSGCGKSTLASALVARGFTLVSDDVLPLRPAPEGQEIIAGPGLPELRLYMAAAELTGVSEYVSPPGPGQTKGRWTPGPEQITNSAAPLARLYLLQSRQQSSENDSTTHPATRLEPTPAFLSLVQNSFWLHSKETKALTTDLVCFAQVVRSVPISRLSFELSSKGFTAVERLLRYGIN